jgi:hypothetical protein
MDVEEPRDREASSRFGAMTFRVLYRVAGAIADLGVPVMVEAPFRRGHSEGRLRALLGKGAGTFICCTAPTDVLRRRFSDRLRTATVMSATMTRKCWPNPQRYSSPTVTHSILTCRRSWSARIPTTIRRGCHSPVGLDNTQVCRGFAVWPVTKRVWFVSLGQRRDHSRPDRSG